MGRTMDRMIEVSLGQAIHRDQSANRLNGLQPKRTPNGNGKTEPNRIRPKHGQKGPKRNQNKIHNENRNANGKTVKTETVETETQND